MEVGRKKKKKNLAGDWRKVQLVEVFVYIFFSRSYKPCFPQSYLINFTKKCVYAYNSYDIYVLTNRNLGDARRQDILLFISVYCVNDHEAFILL